MGAESDRPFAAEELAAALRPFGASRTLPARAYTDPEVLAWERRRLFAGAWTCVGRRPAPEVTHWAVTAGDVGVLLAGDRAFGNVCRHRGARTAARRGY